MTIEERMQAIAEHVELLASMQLETESRVQKLASTQLETQTQLKRLTREVRIFRHFVLTMGANLESRVLYLEDRDEPEEGTKPA